MKVITIEIFKTNVNSKLSSTKLVKELSLLFPGSKINFDLDDCDKILRIEGSDFIENKIIEVLSAQGYHCERLD